MAGKRVARRERKRKRRWVIPALCFLLVSVVLAPRVPARDQPPVPEQRPGAAEETVRMVRDAARAVREDRDAAAQLAAAEEARRAEEEAGAEPVEDAYFADAVFIGDSRTEAFYLYSGLKEGSYFYATGATVKTVQDKATVKTPKGKKTVLEAVKGAACAKIYIMLGVNELGWVYPETFAEEYGKVVDQVRRDHPDAEIGIQSILPVSAAQAGRRSYVNNERIDRYNELLMDLAEEKDCVYLDVASALRGEDGTLPDSLTGDGVHPNTAGCRLWLDYLRRHPLSVHIG